MTRAESNEFERQQVSALHHRIGELEAENARLREELIQHSRETAGVPLSAVPGLRELKGFRLQNYHVHRDDLNRIHVAWIQAVLTDRDRVNHRLQSEQQR